VTVVTDSINKVGIDNKNQRISTATFEEYKAWEKLGILNIETVQELARNSSGWKDWYALTQEGVRARINVTATEKGWHFLIWPNRSPYDRSKGYLFATTSGVKRVTRIVQNEQKKAGADEYRIVMGLLFAQWRPEVVQKNSLLGNKLSEKRKFIVLLKHDPFASTWKHITADHANENEEFLSKNVDSELLRLRAF
jgi:hypothetical protein